MPVPTPSRTNHTLIYGPRVSTQPTETQQAADVFTTTSDSDGVSSADGAVNHTNAEDNEPQDFLVSEDSLMVGNTDSDNSASSDARLARNTVSDDNTSTDDTLPDEDELPLPACPLFSTTFLSDGNLLADVQLADSTDSDDITPGANAIYPMNNRIDVNNVMTFTADTPTSLVITNNTPALRESYPQLDNFDKVSCLVTNQETSTDQETEGDFDCPHPCAIASGAPKAAGSIWMSILFLWYSSFLECYYIKSSQSQRYKIPLQLQGRRRYQKTCEFSIYYDENETYIMTEKHHSDIKDKVYSEYIQPVGYLKPKLEEKIFFELLPYLAFVVVLVLIDDLSLLSLFRSLSVLDISLTASLFLQFFFSLSNKFDVMKCWLKGSTTVKYIPYDNWEDFQHVGQYLEYWLVDVKGWPKICPFPSIPVYFLYQLIFRLIVRFVFMICLVGSFLFLLVSISLFSLWLHPLSLSL